MRLPSAAVCYPSLLNTVTSDPDIADFLILLSRFGALCCMCVVYSIDPACAAELESNFPSVSLRRCVFRLSPVSLLML